MIFENRIRNSKGQKSEAQVIDDMREILKQNNRIPAKFLLRSCIKSQGHKTKFKWTLRNKTKTI